MKSIIVKNVVYFTMMAAVLNMDMNYRNRDMIYYWQPLINLLLIIIIPIIFILSIGISELVKSFKKRSKQ